MWDVWWTRLTTLLATGILVGAFTLVGAASQSRGHHTEGTRLPPAVGALLRGRTIIIDPGHGGWDPGAIGHLTTEAQVNLAVSLKLRDWLRLAGARVLMTWDSPDDIPSDKKYRVRDRARWINAQHADVLIDIHGNSGHPSFRHPQTFYWNGAASYHLARDVQEELQYLTKTHRDVKRIDQYVLRYATMPAINVEIGYLTNPEEERLLMTPAYQNRLAWYIFVGLERWFVHGRWPASMLKAPPPTDLLVR